MYYVYMLECKDGCLYTGITTDIKRRLQEHLAGTASKYTKAHRAHMMRYSEKVLNRSAALKREAEIKKYTRAQKINLIHGEMY